jgi:hypothetical protein
VSLARRLLLALWAGLLVTIGGLVAPTVFAVLPDRRLAGVIAGELFRRTTLVSVAVALVLYGLNWARAAARGAIAHRAADGARLLAPAVLLALSEYAVRPVLEAARAAGGVGGTAFVVWHGVSALLYAAATLYTVALLVGELRERA